MKDSEDHATLELPGLIPETPAVAYPKRAAASRAKNTARPQVQLELLEPASLPGSPEGQPEPHGCPSLPR